MIDQLMTEELKQKLREGIVDAVTNAGDWELSANKKDLRIEFDGINLQVCSYDEKEEAFEVLATYRIDFTRI
jgi:hypothetical protein